MISRPPLRSSTAIALLETDEQSAHRVANLVAESLPADEIAVTLVDIGAGRWRVAMHFRVPPDEKIIRALAAAAAGDAAAKALRFEQVAAKDWVRESLAGLAPVTAGRFVVHGAHDRVRIPLNRIGIEIEAALAFGTGHHGTTRGCLLALDAICKATRRRKLARTRTRFARANRPLPSRGKLSNTSAPAHMRILDVGTGSGVLAIAAARALHAAVLATDIDAFAVKTARDNARHNLAGNLVSVMQADGVGVRAVRARGPYDLIFANILLAPLKRIATPLRHLIASGGRVVLSGILPSQANAVIAAYQPLALQRRLDIDGWTTLVLVRRRL